VTLRWIIFSHTRPTISRQMLKLDIHLAAIRIFDCAQRSETGTYDFKSCQLLWYEVFHWAYFSVQLITICAVVKSKRVVDKGNVCTKKCRDSGQNEDLCAYYQVMCSWKSCL